MWSHDSDHHSSNELLDKHSNHSGNLSIPPSNNADDDDDDDERKTTVDDDDDDDDSIDASSKCIRSNANSLNSIGSGDNNNINENRSNKGNHSDHSRRLSNSPSSHRIDLKHYLWFVRWMHVGLID